MNKNTQKALVKKYADMITTNPDVTREEISELLEQEEKVESKEDADNILAELYPGNGKPPAGLGTGGSLNRKYEEWKVKPVYEDILDNADKVIGRKLTGYEKDAQKPIKTTLITPDKAELLNSQSENTLLRLYEVA